MQKFSPEAFPPHNVPGSDLEGLRELKAPSPDYAVVAYINTTSELKTECDVCVTSSSAVEICKKLEQDKILFIPDPNLGHYVAEKLPEKTFAFYTGGCPRHIGVSAKDVEKARAAHPDALFRHIMSQVRIRNK